MVKIVLLSGKAGCGKTTFADYLEHKHGYVQLALAKKVKELTFKLLQIFNVKIKRIEDLDDRTTKEKYRKYLQLIATEAMRSTFGNNFWCEQLTNAIESAISEDVDVVISDVRFPNEQEFFTKRFNQCEVVKIMIHRNEADKVKTTHSSEDVEKLSFDKEFDNNGTIDDLKHLIDDWIKEDQILFDNIEPEEEIIERATAIDERMMTMNDERSTTNDMKRIIQPPPTTIIHQNITNDERFNTMMTTNNNKNSSQGLGVIGENYVLETLQHIKPSNETLLVSTMPHVADLHSIDYINNLFWVIEVKNKSNLTPEDVDKFKRDLVRMSQQHANDKLKVIGLFLSLRSTSIPKIGELYISGNEIYLSKTYFSAESLKIVFNFVESYQQLFSPTANIQDQQVITSFDSKSLELLALLNTEYQHLTRDLELYDSMRSNCSTNLQHIEELTISARMKQRLIYCLNRQISSNDDVIDKSTEDVQYNSFIEYVKQQPTKAAIQKKVILNRFPALMVSINRIGWNEYRDQAWNIAKVDESTTQPETFNINDYPELVEYVKTIMSNKRKLLKNDILKQFPNLKNKISIIGWDTVKQQLLTIE